VNKDKQLLKQALRVSTQFWVYRYLICARTDGAGKAEAHRELCCIFIAVFFDLNIDGVNTLSRCYQEIHEATQELTGKLETAIGYPIDRDVDIDYEDLAPKFFDKFYELALAAIKKYNRR